MNHGLQRAKNPLILWILLLGLLIRITVSLVALWYPERAIQADTPSYMSFAEAIMTGHGWEYPSAMRTPGYPLWLAGLMTIFDKQVFWLVAAQALLSAATIGLTYSIGRRVFDDKIASFAAFLLAINLESITHSFFLLTETLFTFLFVLMAYFLLDKHSSSWRKVSLAGFFLGLGILTRPLALYYPVLALVLILWGQDSFRIRVRNSVCFITACGLVVIPWMYRNSRVMELFTVSTISEYNLLYYNAASVLGDSGQPTPDVMNKLKDQVQQLLSERGLPDTETNNTRIYSELGKKIILSDPVRYMMVHFVTDLDGLYPDTELFRIFGVTTQPDYSETLSSQGAIAVVKMLKKEPASTIWALILILALNLPLLASYAGWGAASFTMVANKQYHHLVFLSMPIFYSLLLPGVVSYSRFRVPAVPFIDILAAMGIMWLVDKYQQRKKSIAAKNL